MRIKTLQLKKTAFAVLIGLLLSVAGVTNAFAQTFTVGNLNYSVNEDGVSVTVTGHVDGQNATGELVIPESVEYEGNSYSVTIIDVYAFRYCSNLTGELIIPNTVTEIRMGAFSYCSGFSSLTIGTGVTLIGSNDYGYLYQHTNPFGYCSGITTIYYNAINCYLTPVGDTWNNAGSQFANCQSFSNLYIGENVQCLPYYAFKNCSAITTLYFNAINCTSASSEWISNCTSLTNLVLSDNVQTMPSYLVSGCSSLIGNLSIPSSVTTIGNYAFSDCSGLNGSLTLPNSVVSIGEGAFKNCVGLTGVLNLPNSITSIGESTFEGCSGLSGTLSLPSSLTSIGAHAFDGCSGLTGELVILDAITNIGFAAFRNCVGITTLTIGSGLVWIDQGEWDIPHYTESAFYNCTGITTLNYNAINCQRLMCYGDDWDCYNLVSVFSTCSSLATINIGENVQSIPTAAFKHTHVNTVNFNATNCSSMGGYYCTDQFAFEACEQLTTLNIGENVQTIPDNAFKDCSSLNGSLTLPNSVVSIGEGAFKNCVGLTGVLNLPNSITSIGESTFEGCSGLSGTLSLPSSLTSIGAHAFDGCSGLTGELVILDAITNIGFAAFRNCVGITTLTIGSGLVWIDQGEWDIPHYTESAFYNCTGITTLNYNAINCQRLMCYGDDWDCYNLVSVFSTCSSLATINIGENVQSIPTAAFKHTNVNTVNFNATNCNNMGGYYCTEQYAFEACEQLTTINIGDNVQTIPYHAFDGVVSLTGTLTIPESVTSIGERAFANTGFSTVNYNAPSCNYMGSYDGPVFANCSNLITLNIGNNVVVIPPYAFYNCSSFAGSINLPSTLTTIGEGAFQNCTGFTGSLVIPESVTVIGQYAFRECSSLNGTLTIGNSVTEIGANAFYHCYELSGELNIPNSVETIGIGAFIDCGFTGTLTIGTDVSSINNSAFRRLNINEVHWNAVNCTFAGDDYWNYNIFNECNNLTTLVFGDGVETIPEGAFYQCYSLTGPLNLPNSLTSIGGAAFYGCSGFTGNLVIPDSVTYIGWESFNGCTGLVGTLTIGNSVSEISNNSFYNTGLTSLNYNAANGTSIGSYDYGNASVFYNFTMVNFGDNVESLPTGAFRNCTNLAGSLVLPNSLTTIGDQAFYNCYGLESVVMGNSVETIGAEAFRNCGGLRGELTLPETLQSVGNYAFASCDELTTINYNAINCTAMGNAQSPVFYDCASMAHINIGENVESIPNYAFKRCSTVTGMTVAATVPPTVGSSTFGTLQRSIPVTVQCEATAAYQAAQYWNEFTNYNEGFNYVLEVTCDPERGTVVVNKMADCDDPTARVTAYPEMGYAFLGWSENGTLVSEANPYTFTMESSRELQAEFIPGVSYSVTVSVVPAAAGTVTGQGNYNDGSAVTLTAMTNPGYAFVNWTENGSVVSTDEEYTFTIHANRNLVANFTPYAYHWDVNIHQYPGNMTAIGVIQIDGIEQTTPTLEIGAFCNDECRGRQLLTYYPQVDRYMVFLMLYGEDGDEMSFKLYDHVLEQELTLSCTSLVTFAANTALGNPVNPYVFNFINSQQTPLAEGWTWYSTYIEQEDIEGLQMMTEALNESGVMIKSQTGFIANSGGQWMGNLDEITNESMYMVNTTAATLLDMVGNSAIASQHPITMNPGWNWIGYPMATANSVSVALSDLEAQPNDVLKSQESFATYYEGMGWFGSLNTITPGMGLMYDSKNDAPVTFTYTEGRSGELKRNVTAESNHWVPDMHKYTNNMNVMAVVELDDVELRDSRYELAVFAGNECRGSVRLVYVEPIDRYVAFLTVAGREATDLQFVLFDADENREYGNAKESLVFESDAVVGNTKSMMTVHFASCEQENDWSNIAVYPNPADGGEHFSIVLPAASDQKVRVEIINELGAVVSVAQSSSLPMEMKAPATSGLYTLKIVAEGNAVCFRKLVVK